MGMLTNLSSNTLKPNFGAFNLARFYTFFQQFLDILVKHILMSVTLEKGVLHSVDLEVWSKNINSYT